MFPLPLTHHCQSGLTLPGMTSLLEVANRVVLKLNTCIHRDGLVTGHSAVPSSKSITLTQTDMPRGALFSEGQSEET